MRILTKLFIVCVILLAIVVTGYYSIFYVKGPSIQAKSYILIDADTRKVLHKKNENIPLSAASMSKMMTEYIVLKHIKEGKLDWDDEVNITENYLQSTGVKIEVTLGTTIKVRDLFQSMVIASANNAAVALAEKIAGSEEQFTVLMNEQAKELGLSKYTHFVNATGLPNLLNEESVMTASDVAELAYHLLYDFPEVLDTTKLSMYQLQYDGSHVFTTNEMLHSGNADLWFEGVDGLKTGFTDQAGYCFAGTAKQGDRRLISVVMGTEEKHARFIETKKLFSFGFEKPYVPSLKYIVSQYIQPYF
ncbi:D-alanyl-D-alanine carboxypeptidase family protein [Cytobacillus sp. FJAT-54145]|uniref:D-alanyl-D-alanine carboxypeptidase family protein n=1 Tax=Cytobacillus spartinae TaxID=3299023 RepID=A0ABW6KD25_9BACI